MSDSFTKKRLDMTIALGEGVFGEDKGDTVTISGVRMFADLSHPGGPTMGAMQAKVFGLRESLMNQLTMIGYTQNAIKPKSTVELAAGDDNGMRLMFSGTIYTAWGDYSSQPDVGFNILGHTGMAALIKPVNAISFRGSTDVAVIMSGLAETMGFTFENNGVEVKLSSPYFPGTALMQVRACAAAADINYTLDRGVLAIWPKYGARAGEIPLVSVETGMINYPALNSQGMFVSTLFNPDIRSGGEVEVRSSIPMANGKFRVGELGHSLSSEMPGGPWSTSFQCSQING